MAGFSRADSTNVVQQDLERERDRSKWQRLLLHSENDVLKLIVDNVPLPIVLDRLARIAESQSSSGMLASILLLDADGIHLRHGAAPSLPPEYVTSIDGLAIGPNVGCCGTAAFCGNAVIARDISQDPRWAAFDVQRGLAAKYGLRACWSTPITSRLNRVLGTFALYYRYECEPDEDDRAMVSMLVRTAAIVIEHQQSERLLSAIIDSTDDAIISKDLNGIITSWNRSAERLFGYTAAEAVGQRILMLIPTERHSEEAYILNCLCHGQRVEDFETVRVRKDGSEVNVSITISPIRDASGRVVGASKIARDISDRVRQARTLRQANIVLEQANADLRHFAHSASHDLQEPLRMMTAFTELLQTRFGDVLGPTGGEYLSYAIKGATRMHALLKDLRTYMLVSSEAVEPIGDTDTEAALASALLNLEIAIRESGARIEAMNLPPIRMHRFQIELLFQNLIGNAIRYRRDETPKISISARQAGSEVIFSVSDNGIGIERRYQDEIFKVFKRVHSFSESTGSGMGLAICQRIVERAGGRIWVESEPAKGSTFHFTVPRGESSNTAADATSSNSTRQSDSSPD